MGNNVSDEQKKKVQKINSMRIAVEDKVGLGSRLYSNLINPQVNIQQSQADQLMKNYQYRYPQNKVATQQKSGSSAYTQNYGNYNLSKKQDKVQIKAITTAEKVVPSSFNYSNKEQNLSNTSINQRRIIDNQSSSYNTLLKQPLKEIQKPILRANYYKNLNTSETNPQTIQTQIYKQNLQQKTQKQIEEMLLQKYKAYKNQQQKQKTLLQEQKQRMVNKRLQRKKQQAKKQQSEQKSNQKQREYNPRRRNQPKYTRNFQVQNSMNKNQIEQKTIIAKKPQKKQYIAKNQKQRKLELEKEKQQSQALSKVSYYNKPTRNYEIKSRKTEYQKESSEKGSENSYDSFNQKKSHNYRSPRDKDFGNPNKYPSKNNKYGSNQRSKTNLAHKKKQNKSQYVNRCQKYLKNCQKLQQNQQQIGLQIKKLKKYFLASQFIQKSQQNKPKQISVYKSLDSPVLFFEYTYTSDDQSEKRYMLLRQAQRGLKNKIGDFYQTVKKIYDMNYFPVDICYQEGLLEFIKKKANDIHLILALKQRKRYNNQEQKKNQTLFYYCINKHNDIELIFFDYAMKEITMSQNQIKKSKKFVSEEDYGVFEKFCKNVKSSQDLQMVNFGEEEVESDNQKEKYQKEDMKSNRMNYNNQLKQTENKINKILHTDLTEFKLQLEEKNDKVNQMMSQQSFDQAKLQIISEEVEKMSTNLENFQKVKKEVEQKLKLLKRNQDDSKEIKMQKMKMIHKRLIMAEKILRSELPILGKKKEIFQLLDKNNLIILEGQTGSGKSTQLPQLLCEYFRIFNDLDAKPVIVTQPRKIATRSLSERVAQQLDEKRGHFVDYVASLNKTPNPKAKIIFKLDRLLLDELVQSPTLDDYSCLVIDQAHERTISIDVILGLIKQLLQKRNDFKVIITSASMEISLFEKYFKKKTLKVSGRMFNVDVRYLPSKEQDIVKKIEKAIETELLTERNMLKDKYKGHILVFCSDTTEIEVLSDTFRKRLNHNVFMVIPLHGKLSPEDQKKAFSKTKQYKLIFASRIAETAITIDGVKVVIDPGWDRQMQFDQKTKFSSMKMVTISQSSAKQRAGRAGRTQEGFCFRLYSQHEFKERKPNKLPEIKNIALETLVLRLKVLRIDNVYNFDYIQKPDSEGMKTSIQTLKMIGCLDKNQKITTIGRFLVKIPIQPFLARSIIEGILMQKVLQMSQFQDIDKKHSKFTISIIQILCMILNAGNLFRITENFKQLGQKVKYQNFSHQKGDFFFLKNIYDHFIMVNDYQKGFLNQWLKDNFLIRKTLIQVKDLVKQITSIIKNFQVDKKQMYSDLRKCYRKLHKYQKEEDRILSCLTTSFAANLCLYSGHPFIGYTYMSLQKTVSIYGTSCLSLLGICPKWILAYDFYENKQSKVFCKVAHQITYQFLQNTVEEYVFDKFELSQKQKSNPFYKELNYSVQSYVLGKLKQIYRARHYNSQKDIQFIKDLDIQFKDSQNRVIVFYKVDNKKNNQNDFKNQQIQIQKSFNNLLFNIKNKTKLTFYHNYVGNIYAYIDNGFQIKNLQIKNTQIVFQLSELDQPTFHQIKDQWTKFGYLESFGKDKIKFYADDQEIISSFKNYIQFLQDKKDKKFKFKNQISDKRKKIPQTKIYLHWFAGTAQNDNILIRFSNKNKDGSIKQLPQLIKQVDIYKNHINDAILKVQFSGDKRFIQKTTHFGKLRTTAKMDALNLFDSGLDEIDLHQLFLDLLSNNVIQSTKAFQMPTLIKKFRSPHLPDCTFNNTRWTQQIKNMLEKIDRPNQNCIRVWGYGLHSKKQQEQLSDYQRSFRIDMKAEIKTFDLGLLQKMKKVYDRKLGVLGCQKVHVTAMYSQSVVAVSQRVFQYLYDEFLSHKQDFRVLYPNLTIQFFKGKPRRNDKKIRIYITMLSSNRKDLTQPLRVLNELFSPKFLVLPDIHYKYLESKEGDKMLQLIQQQFNYKISFGYDKNQRRLKLYCQDSLTNKVQTILKQHVDSIKYHQQQISYKGKNLKKVQQIIKTQQKSINQQNQKISNPKQRKQLLYQIIFSRRMISITSNIQTINRIKKIISEMKIVEKAQNLCQMCTQQMITPYKLLNCLHSFCWYCLSFMIREFKVKDNDKLVCCHTDQKTGDICNKLINMYDIASILSDQQLQKMCDIRISKFIDTKPQKYQRCFSPNCQQFFDRQQLKDQKQIDCELCGRNYCLQCKESHKNYTCKQWKQRQDKPSGQVLSKMGIKVCPKCGNGIQKNKGCNHISCRCGAHICWKCLAKFRTASQCQTHLAKNCGGIFDSNLNNVF